MFLEDVIEAQCNFYALLRNGGKIVQGSRREGHNVFTITGRNMLSKLLAWQIIAGTDLPYTERRIRWIGVGVGSQLEVTTVSKLAQAVLATPTDYLVPVTSPPEFPTSSSVRFIKEFSTAEITVTPTPVSITEAALYGDVNPAGGAPSEDIPLDPGTIDTTMDPSVGTNPPVAYKAFEPLTKTIDFTLEIRWDVRF